MNTIQKIGTIIATLATLATGSKAIADQYQQIDLARSTDETSLIRLGAGTTELPFGTEAYTLTDIIPGEETSHLSETTAITPIKKGIGPVADAVLSSNGDYLSAGVGYSGNFPLGAYGLAFYLPITTGDGPTFGLIGVKPINDRFSLEGFYLRQSLEGPDFYSGEIQANAKLKDGIEAFVTGVLTSEGNSARAGIRLK